jgi:C4-dicarboxylate transporter DctQ subunit
MAEKQSTEKQTIQEISGNRKKSAPARIMKVFDLILGYSFKLSIIFVAVMVITTFIDVSLRFLINKPITGVTEVNILLNVWMPFLGAAYALKMERHVVLDSLIGNLRPKPRAILTFYNSILGVFVSVYLIYYGTISTISLFSRGVLHEASITIPFGLYTAVIPICGLLLFVQFIRRMILHLDMWRGKIPLSFAKAEH